MLERYGTYLLQRKAGKFIYSKINMSKSALKLTKAENLIMGTFFWKSSLVLLPFENKHRSTEENFSLPIAK
jgi:hypothetical protein